MVKEYSFKSKFLYSWGEFKKQASTFICYTYRGCNYRDVYFTFIYIVFIYFSNIIKFYFVWEVFIYNSALNINVAD